MAKSSRTVRVSHADLFKKRKPPVGSRPGALALPKDSPKPKLRVFGYSADSFAEKDASSLGDVEKMVETHQKIWLDVQGLGDEDTLLQVADMFQIHPVALADVVNMPQRPKTESYESQQLFICGMLRLTEKGDLESEKLSLFIGRKYVITFQEKPSAVLDPVARRLREGIGFLRSAGCDHLGYAVIDTIVDGYYPVLEGIAEGIEEIEDHILKHSGPEVLGDVTAIKRTLLLVRRAVWPLRDALGTLLRDPVPMVTDSARVYLRDTYDHTIQISEMTESYREIASELTNTYLSVLGNRTNDVMRVLTVVTAIFIPLTFIVGVYGMNFDFMPELRWKYGYFVTLGFMLTIGVGMIVYFRRRGWLGAPPPRFENELTEPGRGRKRKSKRRAD